MFSQFIREAIVEAKIESDNKCNQIDRLQKTIEELQYERAMIEIKASGLIYDNQEKEEFKSIWSESSLESLLRKKGKKEKKVRRPSDGRYMRMMDLDLSVRTQNCLESEYGNPEIHMFEDVSKEALQGIWNMGQTSTNELIEKLAEHNIKLKGE